MFLDFLSVTQIDWVNITEFIQPEDGGGGEAVAGVVRQLQYPTYYYENTTAVKMELFFDIAQGCEGTSEGQKSRIAKIPKDWNYD